MVMESAGEVRCKEHPEYKGISFPKNECIGCVCVWLQNHYPQAFAITKEFKEAVLGARIREYVE
jgi:hypothetical protein